MLRRAGVVLCSLVAALLLWGRTAEAGPKVAIVKGYVITNQDTDLQAKLKATGSFASVDIVDAYTTTPTLAQLQAYDAVIVATLSTVGFSSATTLGNLLSQYVDGGGGVVTISMLYHYPNNFLGTFSTKYNLVDSSTSYTTATGLTLGMVMDATHPVMQGVKNIATPGSYCYYYSGLNAATPRNGSKVIATLSNGNALVVAGTPNGRPRVDLNIGIASTDISFYGCWDSKSDVPTLISNALLYVANPLRATPSSVNFGDIGVMTVSAAQTVQVTNTGTAPIVVTGGAVSPTGEFSVTLDGGVTYPITLNAGMSFSFDVTVRPTSTGTRSATYTVTPMSGMGASPLIVQLTANGIGPRLGLAPSTVDFGGIKFNGAGMTSAGPNTVTISNSGGGQLRVNSIMLTDTTNFSLDTMGLMLPNVLVGGAFATVGITFTPQTKGKYTANLNVNYDLIGGLMGQTGTVPITATSGDPQIQIPGANISLPSVRLGQTGPTQYITVTNVGLAQLTISKLSLTGMNSADYKILNMVPGVVAPNGGQYDIQVVFAPTGTMSGLRTATLTIANDDPDMMRSMSTINLSAQATVANFAMMPTSIDFSNGGTTKQQTGQCSGSQNVTITNSGNAALNVTNITFSGTNPGSFRQLSAGKVVPPNNGTLIIPVQFCPVNIGTQTANLVVATDLMAGHMATVSLTGIGTGPHITASPGMVDLGAVFINTPSKMVTITLQNTGDQNLVIMHTTPPAMPFTLTSPPADNTMLAPNAMTTFQVSITPTQAMPYSDTITMTVNDQAAMGVLKIPVTASGIQANISVTPNMINFPTTGVGVKSPEQTVTIQNTGTNPLTGIMVSILGTNSQDFGTDGVIPMSIDPGMSASFKAYFKPQGASTRSATLKIVANGLQVPQQVPMTGTGKSLLVSCNPEMLEFGAVQVGQSVTKQVTCTNQDNDPVNIALAFDDFMSDWSAGTAGDGGATLTIPGAGNMDGTLVFTVTFTPTGTGQRGANLNVTATDSGIAIASVSLDATGVPMMSGGGGNGCNCEVGAHRGATGGLATALLAAALGLCLLRRRRRE